MLCQFVHLKMDVFTKEVEIPDEGEGERTRWVTLTVVPGPDKPDQGDEHDEESC